MVVNQYANDVLVAGKHSSSVRQQALRTKADLERAGWVVSRKSSLDPSSRVKWMGKVVGGGQGRSAECPSTTSTPHLLLALTSHHRIYGKRAEAHAGETTVGTAVGEGDAAFRGWRLLFAQPGNQHCEVYPTQGSAKPFGRHGPCIGPMGAPRLYEIH